MLRDYDDDPFLYLFQQGQALWGRQGRRVSMAMCSQALPLRMKSFCNSKDGLLGMSLKNSVLNSVLFWLSSVPNAQYATEGNPLRVKSK